MRGVKLLKIGDSQVVGNLSAMELFEVFYLWVPKEERVLACIERYDYGEEGGNDERRIEDEIEQPG